jgi:hypothetical protein
MNTKQTHPEARDAVDVHQPDKRLRPSRDVVEYFQQFARERPKVVALWCFGIGFVLGWKLKPW